METMRTLLSNEAFCTSVASRGHQPITTLGNSKSSSQRKNISRALYFNIQWRSMKHHGKTIWNLLTIMQQIQHQSCTNKELVSKHSLTFLLLQKCNKPYWDLKGCSMSVVINPVVWWPSSSNIRQHHRISCRFSVTQMVLLHIHSKLIILLSHSTLNFAHQNPLLQTQIQILFLILWTYWLLTY